MPGLLKGLITAHAIIGLALGLMPAAMAQPVGRHRYHPPGNAETVATATLDTLSVRFLRVDRPWNPKICIGCEANSASLPARFVGRHLR
jgi:DNA-binding transcriptional regulator YdaS (Cro superfamily)